MRKGLIVLTALTALTCLTGCKEYLKQMETEYATLEQINDQGEQLKKLRVFRKKYESQNFSAEKALQILENSKKLEQEIISKIKEDYNREIANNQPKDIDNFGDKFQKNNDLKNITEKYLSHLDGIEDKSLIKKLQEDKDKYEKAAKQYKHYARIKEEIESIFKDGWKENLDTASKRYTDICYKFADYPDVEKENELRELHNELRDAARKVADHIVENVLNELDKKYSCDLQDNQHKEQLKYLEKYLPAQKIRNYAAAAWGKLEDKQKTISENLEKNQEEKKFEVAKGNLQKILNRPGEQQTKIKAIRNFILENKNKDVAKDYVDVLERHLQELKIEYEFENFKSGCDNLIEKSPLKYNGSGVEYIARVKEYRKDIKEKIKKLESYVKSSCVAHKARELKNNLQQQINEIEKVLGDGTLASVQDKEEKYKKEPNQNTREELKAAIDSFYKKGKYPQHKPAVDSIDKNYKKDWRNRENIQNAWDNLKSNPSLDSLNEFNNACEASGFWYINGYKLLPSQADSYSNTDQLRKYMNYYNFLKTEPSIWIEFIYVGGLNHLKEVWNDQRIILSLEKEKILDIKFAKAEERYEWKKGQPITWKSSDAKFIFDQKMNINTKLSFSLEYVDNNPFAKNYFVQFNVDAIEILVKLAQADKFSKKYSAVDNSGVDIEFEFKKQVNR